MDGGPDSGKLHADASVIKSEASAIARYLQRQQKGRWEGALATDLDGLTHVASFDSMLATKPLRDGSVWCAAEVTGTSYAPPVKLRFDDVAIGTRVRMAPSAMATVGSGCLHRFAGTVVAKREYPVKFDEATVGLRILMTPQGVPDSRLRYSGTVMLVGAVSTSVRWEGEADGTESAVLTDDTECIVIRWDKEEDGGPPADLVKEQERGEGREWWEDVGKPTSTSSCVVKWNDPDDDGPPETLRRELLRTRKAWVEAGSLITHESRDWFDGRGGPVDASKGVQAEKTRFVHAVFRFAGSEDGDAGGDMSPFTSPRQYIYVLRDAAGVGPAITAGPTEPAGGGPVAEKKGGGAVGAAARGAPARADPALPLLPARHSMRIVEHRVL